MQYVIPAAAMIIVAVIEAIASRERKEAKAHGAKAEKRYAQRAEEMRLSMKMMDATLQLSVVSANALTNGKNNGNVERARKAAEEAQHEYNEFLQKLAAGQVAK